MLAEHIQLAIEINDSYRFPAKAEETSEHLKMRLYNKALDALANAWPLSMVQENIFIYDSFTELVGVLASRSRS